MPTTSAEMPVPQKSSLEVEVLTGNALRRELPSMREEHAALRQPLVGQDPRWLAVLQSGLGHEPFWLRARQGDEVRGVLPLVLVRSRLFGRHLISLSYVNASGVGTVEGADSSVASALISRAVELADEHDVRYLELRHEESHVHELLSRESAEKVEMRLALPGDVDSLRKQLKSKVRNQVAKGEKHELEVEWGRENLLGDFYRIFAINMRDLGTPVFSRRLFAAMLREFGSDAEICLVRLRRQTLAAAILVHGQGITEVPSASSLRRYNRFNANMLMYWHLLRRATERGQSYFDFGRTTPGSNTFNFKKQWGAEPIPTVWQYYLRQGDLSAMRPENRRFQMAIQTWKKMPVWLTRWVGPIIVRGIP